MTAVDDIDRFAWDRKAYRRGKSAGYSEGIVDGWDACMRQVQSAFDTAIAAALAEPEAVTKHRQALASKRAAQEIASGSGQ